MRAARGTYFWAREVLGPRGWGRGRLAFLRARMFFLSAPPLILRHAGRTQPTERARELRFGSPPLLLPPTHFYMRSVDGSLFYAHAPATTNESKEQIREPIFTAAAREATHTASLLARLLLGLLQLEHLCLVSE